MVELEDDVQMVSSELDRTFIFEDEGHTLGSLLTYVLESFPETNFCAYSVRHPSENKIYFRLKVKEGNIVEEVFKRGIQELNKVLNHVKKTFNKAITNYEGTK
ncbi:DNA-directed RNA polymerase, RBP11-like dimerisation domain,DNA-directed RNA polymerases I and III [Cinara cedri]|uniref:DNA-directed RNA polymerase, RBP11-like dimerisation domain,DNA-directed RNA polymerases I and III n=1 Tax=Cinara cedri TaxID=506608 RepID=A0A5E4MC54_9HEMI|nr:DNA-directed RNA polymerase, RBP11-like dimerisation domain,DNA-directed RNA polymerases I and III [Cinara cedri]